MKTVKLWLRSLAPILPLHITFWLADVPEPIYEAKGCVVATLKLDPRAATTNCKLLLRKVLIDKLSFTGKIKSLTVNEQQGNIAKQLIIQRYILRSLSYHFFLQEVAVENGHNPIL